MTAPESINASSWPSILDHLPSIYLSSDFLSAYLIICACLRKDTSQNIFQSQQASIQHIMPKSKSSKKIVVTAWSDWEWDEALTQWKRYRGRGNVYEFEYKNPETVTAEASTTKSNEPEGQTTGWSEWEFDDERKQWKRWCMVKGEYKYEWQDPVPTDSSTSKGKEPEESAKQGKTNLSVVMYRPRWGNLHHWALHLASGNHVYEVTGEAMEFKAEHKAGIIPSNSGSLVGSIFIAEIQPADIKQLHETITSTKVQNDVAEWCCQDYVLEALEALNEEQIVDDEDYAKAKKRLMKRFNS